MPNTIKIDYAKIDGAKTTINKLTNDLDQILIVEELLQTSTGDSKDRSVLLFRNMQLIVDNMQAIFNETNESLTTINETFQMFETTFIDGLSKGE